MEWEINKVVYIYNLNINLWLLHLYGLISNSKRMYSWHNHSMISYHFTKTPCLKVVFNTLKLKNLVISFTGASWRLGRTCSGSEWKLFYTRENKAMEGIDINSTAVFCTWNSKTAHETVEAENRSQLSMTRNTDQWGLLVKTDFPVFRNIRLWSQF